MTIAKSALACIAASGLLLSQTAAAASGARAGAATGQGEELAGLPDGSAPVITLLALLALAAAIALIIGDDGDDVPDSP